MVQLRVKRGEDHFLYETIVDVSVADLIKEIVNIYNGRLKIMRICTELDELIKFGVCSATKPDERREDILPVGEYVERQDPSGRRSGKAPCEKMVDVLRKTEAEARSAVSAENIGAGVCLTEATVGQCLSGLRGAIMIVYPNGLPSNDPLGQELSSAEPERVPQGIKSDVVALEEAQLWWAGKQLSVEKTLRDYVGKNEKTKLVLKLQKSNEGAPCREPVLNEDQRKQFMLQAFRRQEELKGLEEDDDDRYLDSKWADTQHLKKQFHGVQQVKWKP